MRKTRMDESRSRPRPALSCPSQSSFRLCGLSVLIACAGCSVAPTKTELLKSVNRSCRAMQRGRMARYAGQIVDRVQSIAELVRWHRAQGAPRIEGFVIERVLMREGRALVLVEVWDPLWCTAPDGKYRAVQLWMHTRGRWRLHLGGSDGAEGLGLADPACELWEHPDRIDFVGLVVGARDWDTKQALVGGGKSPAGRRLFAAVRRGNVAELEGALGQGASVNEGAPYSKTPLHVAAWLGHRQVAEALIARGANVDALANIRYFEAAPVYWAAMNGHTDVCEVLVANGADAAGGDWRETPLHGAAEYGHPGTCEFFLNHGMNVDVRNRRGMTPLVLAAYNDRKRACELLLAKGADIEARRGSDNLLFLAGVSGHSEVVDVLRRHGHPVRTLAEAASVGDVDLVRGFLAKGCAVEAEDSTDLGPLHLAAINGRTDVCRLLLESGADLNAPSFMDTPLHVAARRGREEVARLLIEAGADVNSQPDPDDDDAPLHVALSYGHPRLAELLIAKGADVNGTDGNHTTALQIAVEKGYKGLADFLLERGADPYQKNVTGSNAVHWAEVRGDMPEFLKKARKTRWFRFW